jgi:signal transduction histidine kinase
MALPKSLLSLSPMPIVHLGDVNIPADGWQIATPGACKKYFHKSDACRNHYDSLSSSDREGPIQCPWGFASMLVKPGHLPLVLTGIIPYPRLGGNAERQMAKAAPGNKISTERLKQIAQSMSMSHETLEKLEENTVKQYAMALHEIRKLNRSVKQNAERYCREHSPNDPDTADAEIVHIRKCAELMSAQFDAIELLANESLSELPLANAISVYKIFDKVVRIHNLESDRKITLRGQYDATPTINACDKTFPIIPSVLVSNAQKYSTPSTDIVVEVKQDSKHCYVTVTNTARDIPGLNDSIFNKSIRVAQDIDGSGNGLYLAQLVAKQHMTRITFERVAMSGGHVRCVFKVRFNLAK